MLPGGNFGLRRNELGEVCQPDRCTDLPQVGHVDRLQQIRGAGCHRQPCGSAGAVQQAVQDRAAVGVGGVGVAILHPVTVEIDDAAQHPVVALECDEA